MSDEHATPDEVLEQEIAGGAVAGEVPHAVVPTLAQGVTVVREAPPLRHTSGLFQLAPVATGGGAVRIGREPRRRRILLSTRSLASTSQTSGARLVVAGTEQQARDGYGLELPVGTVPLALFTAGEMWFAAFGDTIFVSWLAELDQG